MDMRKGRSTGDQIRALRADIERRLIDDGAKRIRLLEELERVEKDLRSLVVDASDAGLTTRRIGELLKLSSAGVSKWIAKGREEK